MQIPSLTFLFKYHVLFTLRMWHRVLQGRLYFPFPFCENTEERLPRHFASSLFAVFMIHKEYNVSILAAPKTGLYGIMSIKQIC